MAKHAAAQNRKKRYIPLSFAMIIIVLLTWFLPMASFAGLSLYGSLNQTYGRVGDIVETSAVNNMHSVRLNLDFIVSDSINASYIPTIRTVYRDYMEQMDGVNFYSEIVGFLQQEYSRNQLVPSVHLVFPEIDSSGKINFCTHNPFVTNINGVKQFYTNGAFAQCTALLNTLGSEIDFIEAGGKLYLVRVLSLHQNSFQPYAVMASEINTSLLFQGLLAQEALQDVSVSINNIQLTLLGSGAKTQATTSAETTRSEENGMITVNGTIVSQRYTMQYSIRANMQPMLRSLGQNLIVLFIVLLLCTPLALVIILFFYHKVSRPINKLSRFAKSIEGGSFGLQINPYALGSNEFNLLGMQMNGMSAQLEYQFERLYREELALRDARIKALQSQINPHFLGNTLEIINWEARMAGNAKVCRMLEALSTMMEAVLDRKLRPIVPLAEEMVYVQAYLYIAAERFGKRLTINIDIEDELLEWPVPKLILQPIIENAFEHGIDEQQTGSIDIKIFKTEKDWMKVQVVNDNPLSETDKKKVAVLLGDDTPNTDISTNIGIRNVHQRLKLLYGSKAGLVVENNEKNNTVSSFCIHNKQKEQVQPI